MWLSCVLYVRLLYESPSAFMHRGLQLHIMSCLWVHAPKCSNVRLITCCCGRGRRARLQHDAVDDPPLVRPATQLLHQAQRSLHVGVWS